MSSSWVYFTSGELSRALIYFSKEYLQLFHTVAIPPGQKPTYPKEYQCILRTRTGLF